MANQLSEAETIKVLFETDHVKYGRLFHEASLPYAPRMNAKYILCHVSRIVILLILQGCVDMHVKPFSKGKIIRESTVNNRTLT